MSMTARGQGTDRRAEARGKSGAKNGGTRMKTNVRLVLSLALILLAGRPNPSGADTLVSGPDLGSGVTVRNVALAGGALTGVVSNQSPNVVKNVQILVRYVWLWKDSPGRSDYTTVLGEIPPGSVLNFRSVPDPPLPLNRSDGHFTVEAHVVGFTQIGE
jgi:hypothetical protein